MKNSIKKSRLTGCLLAISLLTLMTATRCSNDAPNNAQTSGEPERQYGSEIFRKNCVTCHGAAGNLGLNGAYDLTKSILSHEERVAVITNGRKLMTPFGAILSAAEIKSVAEYTETLKK